MWQSSTTGSPNAATAMAQRSGACARHGSAAPNGSPRSLSPRSRPPRPRSTASTQPFSTRRCTWSWTRWSSTRGSSALPFSFDQVRLAVAGATTLRVHVTEQGRDAVHIPNWPTRPVIGRSRRSGRSRCGRSPRRGSPKPAEPAAPRSTTSAGSRCGSPRRRARRCLPGRLAADAADPVVAGIRRWRHDHGTPTSRSCRQRWTRVTPVPELLLALVSTGTTDLAQDSLTAATESLDLLQRWSADPRFDGARLVFVTRGAVPERPDEDESAPADPAQAAVWGLVRTAQTEQPDRYRLLDLPIRPDTVPADLLRRGRVAVRRTATGAAPRGLLRPAADPDQAGRQRDRTRPGRHGADHRRHRRPRRHTGPTPGGRARSASAASAEPLRRGRASQPPNSWPSWPSSARRRSSRPAT